MINVLKITLQVCSLVGAVRLDLERACIQSVRLGYREVERVGSGAFGAFFLVLLGLARRQRIETFIFFFFVDRGRGQEWASIFLSFGSTG